MVWVYKNNRGNSVFPKRIPNGRLTMRNNTSGLSKANNNAIYIGEGGYGVVTGKYKNSSMKNKIIIKEVETLSEVIHEYNIMKKMHKISRKGTPSVYGISGYSLLMEYIPGGDLHKWLKKNESKLDVYDLYKIIVQVLKIMQKIHSKDPSFRHNDLHTKNILVDDESSKKWKMNSTGLRLVIMDFGLAQDSQYPNPMYVTQSNKNNFKNQAGIFNGSDQMYDVVTFLKSIEKTLEPIHKFAYVVFHIRSILQNIDFTQMSRPKPGQIIGKSYSELIRLFTFPRIKTARINTNNIPNLSKLFIGSPKKVYNKNFLMKFSKLKTNNVRGKIPFYIREGMYNKLIAFKKNKVRRSPPKPRSPVVRRSPPKPRSPVVRRSPPKLTRNQLLLKYPKVNKGKEKAVNNKFFMKPMKLKNVGLLGAPVKKMTEARLMNIIKNFKSNPIANLQKQHPDINKNQAKELYNLFGTPPKTYEKGESSRMSPFGARNFKLTDRPVNIEEYYKKHGKSMSTAKEHIETIVRTGKMDAWERAKEILKASNINVVKK